MELIVASSSVDSAIGSWDLKSGSEQLRYRSSASPPHGLLPVSNRFLASSHTTSSSSSQILFWSWDKPQIEVRSFPAVPIGPLISNSDGTYIIGGGTSGDLYVWEVASGKLLKKWHGHYRSITCLALSDDESLLISGFQDGQVRVWSLLKIFDDMLEEAVRHRYKFSGHTFSVTDVVCGHGLCKSILISSSMDCTCKIWSLSDGMLLRNIDFPREITAIAIDPGEHVFYAAAAKRKGDKDADKEGKIYVGALSAESKLDSPYGMHIIGCFSDHSGPVNCLTLSTDGVTLVSGSDDGMVRVWDTKKKIVTRVLKHGKEPVNNVTIVREPLRSILQGVGNSQAPLSRKRFSLPPPLEKYMNSADGEAGSMAVLQAAQDDTHGVPYCSSYVMKSQINDFQQRGSSSAAEMELERLRQECKRSAKMVKHWKMLYQDLRNVSVNELLSDSPIGEQK